MDPIPLPAAPALPEAVNIPYVNVAPPMVEMPKWAPVPVKYDDVVPLPKTKAPDKQKERLNQVEEMMTPSPPLPESLIPEVPKPSSEIRKVEIPFTQIEVPVPKQEIIVTAVTTAGTAAVVSVGATLVATSFFKEIVSIAKPLIKTALKKLAKVRGKPAPETWARQRLRESRLRKLGKTDLKGGS